MVTRSRRNLSRKEAPPKGVVERSKTKELKKPTTLYLMYFFLALLVFSDNWDLGKHNKPAHSCFRYCRDAKAHETLKEVFVTFQVLKTMKRIKFSIFKLRNPLNPEINPHIYSVQKSCFSTNVQNNKNKFRHNEAVNQVKSARMSQKLWDTLVPERNWSIVSPQFWALLIATVILYTYNRMKEKSPNETKILLDTEKKKHEEIVKNKIN